MIQIDKNNKIINVKKVINDNTPSFSGIVTQECKGKLWVDNLIEPRIAIAESFAVGSFAFLGVNESEEDFIDLKAFLENELFPSLRKNGIDYFEFSIESESIRDHILTLLKDYSLQTEKEFSFRTNVVPKGTEDIPKEYEIRKVDSEFWSLLIDGKYKNADFIKVRLLESWYSVDDFFNKSVAYCTIHDNRIVAVIIGTACYNKVTAIDIETEEQHRRLGLSYRMGVEFIADCITNNLIPQWDCVESNLNSYHLAQKLGFEKINENTVYWFKI